MVLNISTLVSSVIFCGTILTDEETRSLQPLKLPYFYYARASLACQRQGVAEGEVCRPAVLLCYPVLARERHASCSSRAHYKAALHTKTPKSKHFPIDFLIAKKMLLILEF
jgi:hypothetical protein